MKENIKTIEKIFKDYLKSSNPNFQSISEKILRIIKKVTNSPHGFVGYIEEKSGNLILPTLTIDVWKECKMKCKTTVFSNFDNLFGWVIKNKESIISNDVLNDSRSKGIPLGHIEIRRFMATPAIIKNKVVGVLAVANKKEPYNEEDLHSIEKLSNIYSIIIYHLIRLKKIEEGYKHFSEVVENARDIIYVVNKNGIIEYINDRVKDYGYKKEDIVGHITFEFAHPDDVHFLKKALRKAMRTGKTAGVIQFRIRKKNGEYFAADQKSSIVFRKGKPVKIIGMIRDVTYERNLQRELQENKELLEKIFDTATDAIFIKDLCGNYLKVNKACAKIFRMDQNKVPGKNDRDFFGEDVAQELREIEKDVISGKRVESVYKRSVKGKKYIFNTVKVPLKDESGNVKFILGIARDITKLRKLEREMTLLKASENIKKVTSEVSHDINNVLSVISGYATLIEESAKDKNVAKEARVIRSSISKILRIITHFKKKAPVIIKK